ncbi:addiction module antidote protein [Alloscardovia venturai]|uniref:Addiction module antidote protein n=1 Tax=Alloscardovia venturai TaxID=1769421 RepID=A0ABW2Y3F4_9BIFI
MVVKISRFDPAKYLTSSEDIAQYLTAAISHGDAKHFAFALGDVAKAYGMTRLAEQNRCGA